MAPADPPAAGRAGPPTARRIAIVNWRDPWHPAAGGAERYAWELARRFAAGGAEVCFVAGRARGQARRDRIEGVTLVRLGGRFTVYPFVLAWMLGHRWAFDAVLDCQNGIPFFTPSVLPRRVPVLCVVHHVHDEQFGMYFPAWPARLGRFLEGPAARRAYRRHACVAVSPSTVRAMRERLAWTGPIYVVPNGVTAPGAPGAAPPPRATGDGTAPEVTKPDGTAPGGAMPEYTTRDGRAPGGAMPGGAMREKPTRGGRAPDGTAPEGTAPGGEGSQGAVAGGAAELVCVSRLVPHKRVVELLDVAERLRVRVHIIGRGPEGPALRAQIDRRGLVGLVVLHGYLPEADKNALVARASLHLSASRGEGWGLSVTEAAALGVPTVAYDVDGLRDAVLDGVTGWLARDGEHLADVVERVLKELADPRRRRAVAAACRAWAAEFGWARSAERMAALLDASVRRGGAAGHGPRCTHRSCAPAGPGPLGVADRAGRAARPDPPSAAARGDAAARRVRDERIGAAVPAWPDGSARRRARRAVRPTGTRESRLPDAVVVRCGEAEWVVEGPVRDELLARIEAAGAATAGTDAAGTDAARVEAARVEAAGIEAAGIEAARIEAARIGVRPATDLERLLGRTGRWT